MRRQFSVRIGVAVGALMMVGLAMPNFAMGQAKGQDDGPSAWDLYEQGRAAEKSGHMAQAYMYYMEASAMEPRNRTYWLRGQAVQSRATMEAKPMPAESGDIAANEPPLEPDTPPIHIDEIRPL